MWISLLCLVLLGSESVQSEDSVFSCCRNETLALFCLRGSCQDQGLQDFADGFSQDNVSVVIKPKGTDVRVTRIAEMGLKIFEGYKSISILAEVDTLDALSFQDINPSTLKLKSGKIGKCTFLGLSNLRDLSISGVQDEINFHKDVFLGLGTLKKLELRGLKNIYTFPRFETHGHEKVGCEHFLCALGGLKELRFQTFSLTGCTLTFSGIPRTTHISPFRLRKYSEDEMDAICPIERHTCHDEVVNKCTQVGLCKSEPLLEPPRVSSASTVALPLIILGLILAAVGVGVGVWFYASQQVANPAGSGPVAV